MRFVMGEAEVTILLVLFFIVWAVVPFFINYRLARSRGKSVPLMMLLTVVFSWIVTLILAFLPKVEKA